MKTIRILALTVISALAFTACDKDDNGINPGTGGNTGDIEFNIGFASQNDGNPQTPVATASDFKAIWEDGDEIGIFAVSHPIGTSNPLATAGNYIHNVKLAYSDADGGKWTVESGTKLTYLVNGDQLDFYAYYPYDNNGGSPRELNPTSITLNVSADQTTEANYKASNLLMAKTAEVSPSTIPVTLTFAHKLALLQVEVDPGTIKGSGPTEALALTLSGCKAVGTFNLGNGSLTTKGDAVAVKMLRVESDPATATTYTYRALVPAQTVAIGTSLCLLVQNEQLFNSPALTVALELNAGKAKLYTATLPSTALQTVKIIAAEKTFSMGETGLATPVHNVTLTKDYYMSKYAITNVQYAVFLNVKGVGENRKAVVEGFGEQELFDLIGWWNVKWENNQWVAIRSNNIPMINVTWFGAKAYADWVGGSLPTEAEWEYACRAGTTTAYSFGDNAAQLGDYAWYSGADEPKAIGTKLPNPWGLYDMHGNVWEWCSDWHATYDSDAVTDPTGPTNGSLRVLRGGSWFYDAPFCRSAFRYGSNPDGRNYDVGFRVVFVP